MVKEMQMIKVAGISGFAITSNIAVAMPVLNLIISVLTIVYLVTKIKKEND